jgi:hypothetical protein
LSFSGAVSGFVIGVATVGKAFNQHLDTDKRNVNFTTF